MRLCERLLRRIPADLRSILDPEDVLQESHVEVFRRIESFQPHGPGSFHRWTAAIALSRLRNNIKKYRAAKRGGGRRAVQPLPRNLEDSVVGLFNMVAAPGETPSRIVAKREAVDAVQSGLKDLPEQYRRAIWLVHIEGQSVKDAAAAMGRSERAIHGLCRRGLKLLEGQLGNASRFLSSSD